MLRLLRERSGAAAVEAALVLPAFLALLLGVVETGRLIWAQATLVFAVEEAARCASVNKTLCGSAAQIQAFAAGKAVGLDIPTGDFVWSTLSCGNQVSASYTFSSMIPSLVPYALSLTARACFPS